MKFRSRRLAQRCRGLAIPVAIGIVLVLITLVLAVILYSRSTGRHQKVVEKQMQEVNVAEAVKGKMQEVFASGDKIDPARLKEIGMSSAPNPPGGEVQTFKGKIGDVEFSGSFNGGEGPWSTYVALPKNLDPKTFGFAGPKLPAYDSNEKPLPQNHSRIFVNVKAPNQETTRFFYTFSNNSPYGLVAPKGNVKVAEATAVTAPSAAAGTDKAFSQDFYIQAGQKIQVKGKMTGTAKSQLPKSSKPVEVGEPQGQVEDEVPPIPPEQLQQLVDAVKQMASEMESNGKDPGFEAFAAALVATSGMLYGHQMINQGGFSFDGKRLVWNGSLFVPKGMGILIPLTIRINGGLVIEDEATAIFGQSVVVDGPVFIGKGSAVMAGKKMDFKDRVEITFPAKDMMGINAAIVATDDIHLRRGVRHCKWKPLKGNVGIPFTVFEPPLNFELLKKFMKAANKLLGKLMGKFNPLMALLGGQITVPMGNEDLDYPGVLIVSEQGGVNIYDNGSDAGLAGLIMCNKSAVIEFGQEGGYFNGICISFNGDIEMFSVNYRYYPYHSSAAWPVGPGKYRTLNVLPQPHLVSSGEYKKGEK